MMLPARAIEMQKGGQSARQIADALGVHVNQVGNWFRDLGYDAAAYHVDAIAEMVQSGVGFYAALQAVGLTSGGGQRVRASRMLAERGVRAKRVTRPAKTQARCAVCEILLEPYDANSAEQRSWQNGTRDGVHCTACEDRIKNGGGWVGHLPLPSIISDEEVIAT